MQRFLLFLLMSGVCHAFVKRECVDSKLTRFLGKAYRVKHNLVYDAEKNLKGDLYLPEGKGPFPAVLFLHGGGWVGGSKGMFNAVQFGQYLACRGLAFFDVDYGLVPGQSVIEQIKDAKCALRFLKGKAKKWGIDKTKIAVSGGSAGGHLSALLAVTPEVTALSPACSFYPEEELSVQAGVHWYGIYDFSLFSGLAKDVGLLEKLFGHFPTEDELQLISPTSYASSRKLPPLLLIHGAADGLASVEQTLKFAQSLTKNNHHVEMLILPDTNHAFDAGVADPRTEMAFQATVDFLNRVFYGP